MIFRTRPAAPRPPARKRGPAIARSFVFAAGLHALALLVLIKAVPEPAPARPAPGEALDSDAMIDLLDLLDGGVLPLPKAATSPAPSGAGEVEGGPLAGAPGPRPPGSPPPPGRDIARPPAPEARAPEAAPREAPPADAAPAAGVGDAATPGSRARDFSLSPGAWGGPAERPPPGPLASASPAERNLRQAFADESVPFGVREPILHAARSALEAPDAPRAGQAYLALSIGADGAVRDLTMLSASTEGEAWARVRDRVAASLREKRLAAGGRSARLTVLLGSAPAPAGEGNAKPERRPVAPAQNVKPDEPEYKGESGSVTPYNGPLLTPGKVLDWAGDVAAAAKGDASPARRTPFARIVRFSRD